MSNLGEFLTENHSDIYTYYRSGIRRRYSRDDLISEIMTICECDRVKAAYILEDSAQKYVPRSNSEGYPSYSELQRSFILFNATHERNI